METGTVAELVGRALSAARADVDRDEYGYLLWQAAEDGPGASALGLELTGSDDPVEREFGCVLLGDAASRNEELRGGTAAALAELSGREEEGPVLAALARAIGRTCDERAVPVLVALGAHPDAAVRYEVASALSGPETGSADGPEVRTLLVLTRDEDPEVRDRATFTLGFQLALDSAEIRAALWERTGDGHAEARAEGVRGLARRHDPRAVALVAELLDGPDGTHVHTFRAAEILGVPELLPHLRRYDLDDPGVAEAVRACDPVTRRHLEAAAWELLVALDRLRPDLRAGLYRERFEPGLSLDVGDGCYDVEALLRRAGGDPERAAALAAADAAG